MERLLEFSQSELVRFLLVICRVSPLMMIAPFWGSPLVPAQVRIYLAILVSVLLMPVVRMPLPPDIASSMLSLALAVGMDATIYFHRQLRLVAVEIEDERTDGMLPPELQIPEPPLA